MTFQGSKNFLLKDGLIRRLTLCLFIKLFPTRLVEMEIARHIEQGAIVILSRETRMAEAMKTGMICLLEAACFL